MCGGVAGRPSRLSGHILSPIFTEGGNPDAKLIATGEYLESSRSACWEHSWWCWWLLPLQIQSSQLSEIREHVEPCGAMWSHVEPVNSGGSVALVRSRSRMALFR